MKGGHLSDAFVFSEALWTRLSRLGRTFSEKELKSIFSDALILSLKPSVCRHWKDSALLDIDSFINYARSRMPFTQPKRAYTDLTYTDKKSTENTHSTLSQILDF